MPLPRSDRRAADLSSRLSTSRQNIKIDDSCRRGQGEEDRVLQGKAVQSITALENMYAHGVLPTESQPPVASIASSHIKAGLQQNCSDSPTSCDLLLSNFAASA